MKRLLSIFLLLPFAHAGAATSSGGPTDESLTYSINWPTGLSLGEAHLRTVHKQADTGEGWATEFTVDASVPGFQVENRIHSLADGNFCSMQLDKKYIQGRRSADETTTFDQQAGRATRQTKNGGKSEFNIGNCARDALDFFQFLRRSLSQGTLPPRQTVYYGAGYNVSIQFVGTEPVRVAGAPVEADRLAVTIKGEKTDITVDAYFEKEPSRRLVLLRVPLSLATFSMELVP
jgi:hypothetical protein